MSSESNWTTTLQEAYARAADVLRSGDGVGERHRTPCTEAVAIERGRDIYQVLHVAAEGQKGGHGEEADDLAEDLWEGLWDGPLELDESGDDHDVPNEFRSLGTLTLTPESTWTILLDCLGDFYIVALEEHPDRASAQASFDSWADEVANT